MIRIGLNVYLVRCVCMLQLTYSWASMERASLILCTCLPAPCSLSWRDSSMGGCSLCVGITARWQVCVPTFLSCYNRLICHLYFMELNLTEVSLLSLIPLHFVFFVAIFGVHHYIHYYDWKLNLKRRKRNSRSPLVNPAAIAAETHAFAKELNMKVD
jgi:hypothetical protein